MQAKWRDHKLFRLTNVASIWVVLCAILVGCVTSSAKDVAQDPFLRPYVRQLKNSTPKDDLRRITTMTKSDLILLLHGYGTYIRNRWFRFHGGDPELARFFRTNGINNPEEASMVIIEALWHDLNSQLTPPERAAVDAKRALVARKRATYEKLESECAEQLTKAKRDFGRCYASHGLPSKNPESRDPFFELLVGKSGHVRKIVFCEGASRELKPCLTKILNGFTFSPFTDDEFVTLYIIEFPSRCRVEERDTVYD